MRKILSGYTEGRDNNFNLIRFVAAILVLFTHSFALSIGTGDAEPFKGTLGMTLGVVAVDIFFISSGFLITSSMLARNNLLAFAWARILRIYPALIVAIIFCVFIIGLFFTTELTWSYLSNTETIKFFIKNITLFFGVSYSLPGVFENIPYEKAVNGSLWTLPYEVKMYAIVALLWCGLRAFKGRFNKKFPVFLLVWVLVALIIAYILKDALFLRNKAMVRLFVMFFTGSAFYVFRDKNVLSGKLFVVMLFILVFSIVHQWVFFVFYVSFIAYIVFYLAYVPSGYIRKFNGFGDYSYGLYIYAFPVQQSIAALIDGVSVTVMLALSFVITLCLSMLSWHIFEKRVLKFKNRYVVLEEIVAKLSPGKSKRRS